eukprot:346539-Chlamydomonas_euryale.AAC.7
MPVYTARGNQAAGWARHYESTTAHGPEPPHTNTPPHQLGKNISGHRSLSTSIHLSASEHNKMRYLITNGISFTMDYIIFSISVHRIQHTGCMVLASSQLVLQPNNPNLMQCTQICGSRQSSRRLYGHKIRQIWPGPSARRHRRAGYVTVIHALHPAIVASCACSWLTLLPLSLGYLPSHICSKVREGACDYRYGYDMACMGGAQRDKLTWGGKQSEHWLKVAPCMLPVSRMLMFRSSLSA